MGAKRPYVREGNSQSAKRSARCSEATRRFACARVIIGSVRRFAHTCKVQKKNIHVRESNYTPTSKVIADHGNRGNRTSSLHPSIIGNLVLSPNCHVSSPNCHVSRLCFENKTQIYNQQISQSMTVIYYIFFQTNSITKYLYTINIGTVYQSRICIRFVRHSILRLRFGHGMLILSHFKF